jgi:hypothetical protein
MGPRRVRVEEQDEKKPLGLLSPRLHVHQFRSLQILCSSISNITFNLDQSVMLLYRAGYSLK